ncbi:MAG TPA: alkaline phosphatase family protein [Anaerolineae bacterium]|nr:alkaline phosphatase family protein [Anaerolineae bacterium]HMR64460.1 alkaline phosphatase family protein [Anaerolineae bacterium]
MSKYLSIVLSIVALATIMVGAFSWTRAFYASVKNYEPPLPVANLTVPAETILPQTARVVVVIVSGLGSEWLDSFEWPILQQLAQTGANATIISEPPTYSQTARMTLVTGASAELNGVPPLDRPLNELTATTTDTVFARARAGGLKTALLGRVDWRTLIPRDQLDETFFIEAPGPEADSATLDASLLALKDTSLDLFVIQFNGLNWTVKGQGSLTGQFVQTAVTQTDEALGQLARAMDLNNSVMVVVGDHGLTSTAGQGGGEPEVSQQPLVMIGKGIMPGDYSAVQQVDLAPTLAALLGVAPPSAAQGRVLFEMLDFEPEQRVVAQLALTQQRLNLAQAYLVSLNGPEAALPESLLTDFEQSRVKLSQNNLSGAFELARLAQEGADTQILQARASRVQAERWPRLLLAGLGLVVWFGLMWQRRGFHVGLVVIAALITLALYHILFQAQGYSYSISSFYSVALLPFDIARRTVVSFLVGGALVLVILMLVGEKDWRTLLGTSYGFGVMTTFLFALPLFWAFWQNGLTIERYFPAPTPVFWQVTGLLEVMIVAGLGLILPWPIMAFNVFINLARRHLTDSQPQTDRGPLPGLR